MTDHDFAITVDHVAKDFILPHQKANSVKGLFMSLTNNNNTKAEVQHALKDISFKVKKGEFFGIVGRNGSGKSTLLKILANIYQPNKGKVKTSGKLVPFIELGVGFNPELTGRENVFLNGAMLGFSKKEVEAMYDEIVSFAELERFMDQKLKNYSSGMQVRLAFSMATKSDADILLIDEVLAVGDADFQRKCFKYFKNLKKTNKTVVFVSHDMGAIKEYCDRVMLIENNIISRIGIPNDIAKEYSKLFVNHANIDDDGVGRSNNGRWGTGDIRFVNAAAQIKNNKIVIKATAKSNKTLEEVQYGINISAQDGKEIIATNNRMLEMPDIKQINENGTVTFYWDILNIFTDGRYYITLTLANGVEGVFDWFQNAISIDITRKESSTTAVLPPLKVEYKHDPK